MVVPFAHFMVLTTRTVDLNNPVAPFAHKL